MKLIDRIFSYCSWAFITACLLGLTYGLLNNLSAELARGIIIGLILFFGVVWIGKKLLEWVAE